VTKIKILKKLYILIGLALFVFILYNVNFAELVKSIKAADLNLIILGLALVIPSILIKSWRWNYLKKVQGIEYKLWDSFLMYNVGFFAGGFSPSQFGELIKIYYLKKDGYSLGKSLSNIILDRLIDAIYLIIISYIGIVIFFRQFSSIINEVAIFSLVAFFLIVLLSRKEIIKKIIHKLIPGHHLDRWKISYDDFIKNLKLPLKRSYLYAFMITVLAWIVYYIQMEIFCLSVKLTIPPLQLAFAVTIAGLVTLLPVSILGMGTREVALITFLYPYYSDVSQVIIFSELILMANIFGYLIGVLCWLIKPLPLKSLKYENA